MGLEDPKVFWERSNVRLGVEEDNASAGKRKPAGGMPFACSVCGTMVDVDRWPKDRHDVVCGECKSGLDVLLDGEPRGKKKSAKQSAREGIPAFSEEDLEAIAEMKARAADMPNGMSPTKGGRGNGRRRKKKRAGGQGGSGKRQPQQQQQQQRAEGGGGRRRRRRRRKGGDAGGGQAAASSPSE
jgi:hypothetical protein